MSGVDLTRSGQVLQAKERGAIGGRVLLVSLRTLGVVTAVVTAGSTAIALAESSRDFVAASVILGSAWVGFLYWSWRSERALLVPASLLLCLVGFSVIAENLLTFERILRVRISNKLELSPRLVEWATTHAVHGTNTWEQFGSDPMFYRRQPGSVYRERYDYRNFGNEYEALVDVAGFRNADRELYNREPTIDMFIVGDSVMEGVGTPGVVEEIRSMLPVKMYSLATGSYSPRQKVAALRMFGLPKRPRWLVVEFYAGNDASEIVEDEVCEELKQDYRCRFDFTLMASGFSRDARYRSLGAFGDFGSLMQHIRDLRSDSMTLSLGTGVARRVRRVISEATGGQKRLRFDGEVITLPGFTHFAIYPERHLEWIAIGLELTQKVYDDLREATRGTGAKVLILYNPTSYEIYRDVLRKEDTDPLSDAISKHQREMLQRYANTTELGFCDLTDGFRELVSSGARGLFGYYDGTHWSDRGRELAAKLIVRCLEGMVDG